MLSTFPYFRDDGERDGEREVTVGVTISPKGWVFVSTKYHDVRDIYGDLADGSNAHVVAHFSPGNARRLADQLLAQAIRAERELGQVNINNRKDLP